MNQLDKKAVTYFSLVELTRLFIFLFFVPVVFAISIANGLNLDIGVIIAGFAIFLAVIVLTAWIVAKLTYKYYKYELQEDVIRIEHGIIWKRYSSIPYDRIQNVDILRGLLARIVGLSDLQIQTAGGASVASNYGSFTEGRLPALSPQVAEQLRDEILRRAKTARSPQGL